MFFIGYVNLDSLVYLGKYFGFQEKLFFVYLLIVLLLFLSEQKQNFFGDALKRHRPLNQA